MRENQDSYDVVLEKDQPEIYKKIWDAFVKATDEHEKWNFIDTNLSDVVDWDGSKEPKYLKTFFWKKIKSIWDLNSEDKYNFAVKYGNFIWYGCEEIEFQIPEEIIKLAFPTSDDNAL